MNTTRTWWGMFLALIAFGVHLQIQINNVEVAFKDFVVVDTDTGSLEHNAVALNQGEQVSADYDLPVPVPVTQLSSVLSTLGNQTRLNSDVGGSESRGEFTSPDNISAYRNDTESRSIGDLISPDDLSMYNSRLTEARNIGAFVEVDSWLY